MHASQFSPPIVRAISCLALVGAAHAQDATLPSDRPVLPYERPLLPPDSDEHALAALPPTQIDQLLYDQGRDGALWARTPVYKARFDGSGATVIPFLGSDAPRNFPLELRATSATRGATLLDTHVATEATREGDTVRIDQGAFVAEYELGRDSLEQRFVFDQLPGAGDLVLRLDVASELAASDLGPTLRFENELGRVDYGQAYALDADGGRITLDSELVDGAIELRVPASFADTAALPLVIDPLVTFYTVSAAGHQEIYPDCSYDVSSDRWCIVWTDVWSANDHDVFARLATGSYQLLGNLTIDFTSESWSTPKIANNNGADEFLVACAVVPSWSPHWSIHGRMVFPGSATLGVPFQISPADTTDRYWPDVGGDPYPGTSSYFCVVWQRVVSSFNVDIEGQMVAPGSYPSGNVIPIETGLDWHEHPYISNSFGYDNGDGKAAWTVTWQRQYNTYDHDIWGAQIRWSGGILHPMFPIQESTWDETEPMAATVLDPIYSGGPRTYLVVYERDYGSDHDIFAAVMDGPTVLQTINLVGAFDPADWYKDQRIPAIDSDGLQFLVGFVERATPSSYDANLWMCDYFWTGSTLVACELKKSLAGSPQMETDLALHSMASSAGARERYMPTWVFEHPTTGLDIVAGLWDGCGGGPVESFCAGDGSSGSCPCNNNGSSGRGCANSANSSGALLSSSGDARVLADSFQLQSSGMPSNASCLFFQGTSNASNVPFGDGRRCVTGTTFRFPLKQSSSGAASFPAAGDPAITNLVLVNAGDTRFYQAWYRDPANFCSSATFNLSNALKVVWAP